MSVIEHSWMDYGENFWQWLVAILKQTEVLWMSLAVNASIVDPYASGLGVYTIQLVKELEKIRQDVIVYTSFPEAFQLTSA